MKVDWQASAYQISSCLSFIAVPTLTTKVAQLFYLRVKLNLFINYCMADLTAGEKLGGSGQIGKVLPH